VYLLDTNVVSETMREQPAPRVMAWLNAQNETQLYLCSIVTTELIYGLIRMPEGKRRDRLASAIQTVVMQGFASRVLPFDLEASRACAALMAHRETLGKPMEFADAQIASIAMSRGFKLVTRNVRHFADAGLNVIDPWAGSATAETNR
jgi:toxin FitB